MSKAQFAILSGEELGKVINTVKTSGARFDALVQRAASQCVAQSIVHRNVSPANDLLNALPRGSRRDSLVAWFEKYGNFAWMKAEKKIAFFEAIAKDEWTPEYAIEVQSAHWTTGTKPAAIVSTYDLETEFGKVLDRFGKMVSDSTKTVEHADLYAKMKAAYTAYVVENFSANDDGVAEPEQQAA